MELTSSYLMLCILISLVPIILSVCPYSVCKCSGHFIDCNWKNFYSMPELTNETYDGNWELTIYGNRLATIPGQSLPANLTFLDLRFNPVTEISTDAFEDSRNSLEILKFTNAEFTSLPPVLLNVTSLKELWIERTPIDEWNPDILNHLGQSVKKLVLNKVGLIVWPDWVKEFPFLSMTVNPFTTIPDRIFSPLRFQLDDLTLNEDSLSQLPKSLSQLTNLKNLDLAKNYLLHLDGLPKSARIEKLFLSYNKVSNTSIDHLVSNLLPYNESLIELDLAHNQLSTIPELDQMSSLSIIKLDGNQIHDSTSGSFPYNVSSINIERNKLTSIPNGISNLSNLTELLLEKNIITEIQYTDIPISLQYLSLSQNKITELNDTSFPQNSSLRKLELDSNPISSISRLAFQNLERLTYLDLSSSELTRAPLAFSSLPNLVTLTLRGSHEMICTCAESQLSTWFLSHNQTMKVSGYCGHIEISKFFLTLAPGC